MLFHRFDKVTPPHAHTDFQRALLKKRFGRRLGQEQHERKARMDDRELQPRVECAEMA
jgi:hypothetical protein